MHILIGLLALLLVCDASAATQRGGERGAGGARAAAEGRGGGFVPPHGPGPRDGGHEVAEAGAGIVPHVRHDGRWIGHESGRDDPHYRLNDPWPHGRFPREIGAAHVFRLEGGTSRRFFFDGYAFTVAAWDYPFAEDWIWDSDSIALYEDPDHDGWYLAYNVRLGTFLHVRYEGLFR